MGNIISVALSRLWGNRSCQNKYLLINDVCGYFAAAPGAVSVDGTTIPVYVCANEFALRSCFEDERNSGKTTPKSIVSRKQLQPDHVPDLQAGSSISARTVTGCDVAKALGVTNPRALLDRLPVTAFWNLAPYLPQLESYSLERVILASLLNDTEIFSSGWSADRILDKLWYEDVLPRVCEVLGAVEADERKQLENEFLNIVKTWLDEARFALVEAAVIKNDPPPVLPLCLLASILEGWQMLSAERMRSFLEGIELGDLFVDIFDDGADLNGLAEWGRRITAKDSLPCEQALNYLQKKVFPKHPSAVTESLATVVKAVDGAGAERLLNQLIRLLEAMVTIHRLTDRAEDAANNLTHLDWKKWLELIDKVYLPLSSMALEAERRSAQLPEKVNVFRITQRAKKACDKIRVAWADFYSNPSRGLPKWINEIGYSAGTCRPWLNSDVVEAAVKPLLQDSGIEQVYLIVFDGMSVANWSLLRDRFLMVPGREMFRSYEGLEKEYRACTYLPSITEYCRQAIFAGSYPGEFSAFPLNFCNKKQEIEVGTWVAGIARFRTWPNGRSEPDLLERCLQNNSIAPSGWDKEKNYLCYNEKENHPDALNRKVRDIVDSKNRFKTIVFNLQDRLLQKVMSSLQEIMLAYVKEVALPHLRRISGQQKTAVVITANHTMFKEMIMAD